MQYIDYKELYNCLSTLKIIRYYYNYNIQLSLRFGQCGQYNYNFFI